MARPAKPWYARGALRTDFAGERNKVLVLGPKNADTKLLAEKALLELREQAKLLHDHPGMETAIAVVVERFLDVTAGEKTWRGPVTDGRSENMAPMASLTSCGPGSGLSCPIQVPRREVYGCTRTWRTGPRSAAASSSMA
jgi:hypothetical protein